MDYNKGNKYVKGKIPTSHKDPSLNDLWKEYTLTGNPKLLEIIVRICSQMIFDTALPIIKDPDQTQDIFQDIFLELIERRTRQSFQNIENFAGWLRVYTRRKCFMYMRKNKQVWQELTDANLSQALFAKGNRPDAGLDVHHIQRAYKEALKNSENRQRFLEGRMAGYTNAQIAAFCDVDDEKKVRQGVWNGRITIEKKLKSLGYRNPVKRKPNN